MRCMHEASCWEENCFITLTYEEDHLPADGGLVKHHFQDFMKRLRKAYEPRRIRFYQCGEYGEDLEQPTGLGRPHFHAIIFNLDFADKKLFSERDGIEVYESETLARIWGKGFVTVGEVTFESAAYVARYVAKKITGDQADAHYWKLNYETGELHQVEQEYNTMSRRPGVGETWWRKFKADTYKGFITVRGAKQRPPRYYDQLLELDDEDRFEAMKEDRKVEAFAKYWDNIPDRLRQKEACTKKRVSRLPRNLK